MYPISMERPKIKKRTRHYGALAIGAPHMDGGESDLYFGEYPIPGKFRERKIRPDIGRSTVADVAPVTQSDLWATQGS